MYGSHIRFNVVSMFCDELLFSKGKANSTLHISLAPESPRDGKPKSFDDPSDEKLDKVGRLIELASDPLRCLTSGIFFSSVSFSVLLNR